MPATADPPLELHSYASSAKRPLTILVFLLPLILAYEVCLALVLRSGDGILTNTAHGTILELFAAFGIAPTNGLFLGGALIVVVLLVWHLLNNDTWRVEPSVPGFMFVESLVLAIPLIVLGLLIANRADLSVPSGTVDVTKLGLLEKLAISIGAGLYEELLFRMVIIAAIHALLVDLAKMPAVWGATIAVAISATGFCWYHHPVEIGSGLFYLLAGLYFGAVFFWRGFGIVVGVHATYDVIVFLMQSTGAD